ncbi:hypothetical protein NVSP9465_02686 [Novosphingobium sp. CECT 9465]|nr:hypothetical protein NVSP9465_02686 [Novosphingobium sp. CECT 9465]
MVGGGSSTFHARGQVDFFDERYIFDIAIDDLKDLSMPASRAIVSTASASRYLQQLCKHWGHKFEATFDSRQGRVALPFGPLELVATDDALSVTCRLEGDGDLDRMQMVVADHINRFAFREGELTFDWKPVT